MKKVISLVVVLVMCFSMVACGDSSSSSLRVGMEIGYPPFEYYDADGTTPTGVDVELAKALGEKMGMEVELIDTAWDGIFSGLDKGDYDVVMSACTITAERLLDYDFSDPYIQNYQCIVTLADSELKPANTDELAGLKVGYQEETTSDIYLTDYTLATGLEVETYEYAKVIEVFSDLENGRLDAVVCDSTVAASYLGEDSIYEETWSQESEEGVEAEEFGVCIKKGNTELQEKINKSLQELKDDGTLDAILAKYF